MRKFAEPPITTTVKIQPSLIAAVRLIAGDRGLSAFAREAIAEKLQRLQQPNSIEGVPN